MAGPDTFRGCSFQAAYSVRLSLDVVEGVAEVLQLEGDTDVVDAALETATHEEVRSVQAKTKIEPYVWYPGEIVEVIDAWLQGPPAGNEDLDFVTDGQLGEGVARKMVPALRRIREGRQSEEDRDYLIEIGLDPDEPALSRVGVHSKVPDGRAILEQETLRLIELRERRAPLSTQEAREVIKSLFGELVLGLGGRQREERRLSRADLADRLGVDLDALDSAGVWSQSLAELYRTAILEDERDPTWTMLDLLEAERPAALTLRADDQSVDQTLSAVELLDGAESAIVTGPAGSGKSTLVAQLTTLSAERSLTPLKISLASYSAASLRRLIQITLEARLQTTLAPRTPDLLLSRNSTVLLIDGAGELIAEQRESLLSDLAEIRSSHPSGARFLLVARQGLPFAELGLAEFHLEGLDKERRKQIADAVGPGQDGVAPTATAEQIEAELGPLVDNPLLFSMALGLRRRGVKARTRADLFHGFIDGFQARPEGRPLSGETLLALACCCFVLRREGRYSAEEWSWLEQIAAERQVQVDRGLLSAEAPAASDVLEVAIESGLVRPLGLGSELGLLHDLFADWFTAEAIRKRIAELDQPVGAPMEEAVAFLAEQCALSATQIRTLASSPIAAARAADRLPAGHVDPDIVEELWRGLALSLGSRLKGRLLHLTLEIGRDGATVCLMSPPPSGTSPDHQRTILSCLTREPRSNLSAAVDLWLAVVRTELNRSPRDRPVLASQDPEELAAQLTSASAARVSATQELIAETMPGLSARLLAEIGPAAIQGWLLPAEETPSPFPGGEPIVEHRLHYLRVDQNPFVAVAASADEVPESITDFSTMIAESYLRESVSEAARKNVKKALDRLIPRAR